MARRKRGLQKNVDAIFSGMALRDVVHPGLSEDHLDLAKSIPVDRLPNVEAGDEACGSDIAAYDIVSPPQIGCDEPSSPESSNVVECPTSAEDFRQDDKIQQLQASVACPKDFTCVRSEQGELCKARVGSKGKVVQCLESKKHACSFRLSFLFKKICRCPIRQYIAKHWGK